MTTDPANVPADLIELENYRSLSILAVAAFLLSLISPVALMHPAAWTIAGAAAAVSVIARIRVRRRADALTGGRLATVSLGIAIFFLACAPTRYFADRWLLYREARQFAEEWLQAVLDGDLSKAHQACLPVARRQPVGTMLDEYYANDEGARIDRSNHFATGQWQRLTQFKPGTTCRFQRNVLLYYERGDIYINQRFELLEPGQSPPFVLQTEVYRHVDPDGVFLRMLGLADAAEVDRRTARHRWGARR